MVVNASGSSRGQSQFIPVSDNSEPIRLDLLKYPPQWLRGSHSTQFSMSFVTSAWVLGRVEAVVFWVDVIWYFHTVFVRIPRWIYWNTVVKSKSITSRSHFLDSVCKSVARPSVWTMNRRKNITPTLAISAGWWSCYRFMSDWHMTTVGADAASFNSNCVQIVVYELKNNLLVFPNGQIKSSDVGCM